MSKSVVDRMKNLLSTGEDADVYFLVGDGDAKELLSAHKFILKLASEVFVAMFRFDAKNEKVEFASVNCPVKVIDVEAAAFKMMLSFIYTGELSELNGYNAMAVLYAAKKYNIPDLVDASLQVPVSSLRNVFLAYALAKLYEMEGFANDCLAYIDKNADTLLKSEEFLQIDQKLLCEIFGPENRRQMLGPALFKIRFPLFSKEEFSQKIEEVVGIKQYHSQSKLCGSSEGLLYGPLQFPSHWRNLTLGTIVMDIEKVSEFAGEKVGTYRYSETVQIRGLSWNIVAKINAKNGSTDQKWLGIYIKCAAAKEDKNWSCECSAATFRIVSKKFDMENSTGKLLGKIFNHTESHAGFPGSVSFAELLYPGNGFYNQNDDSVTLTVDFTLKNAQADQFASVPRTSDRTIFMEIEKISEFFLEFVGSERKSDTVHIKGMPWKIVAQINRSADGEKCLGFYLLCAVPKGTPNWSRKCSASFRIVPRDPREAFDDRIFNNESPIHGFYNFVTFSYLEWVGTSSGWYNKEEDKVTLAIDIYLDDEKRERDSNSIFD
ncbi:hypothetical protein niasHT_018750 [Heterodera trifolii]|uniref:BTB domain-containing protein n=1 Tax=Heterodera trifolii TaxID=157864 RepID=A0ABD2LBH2_9BILA